MVCGKKEGNSFYLTERNIFLLTWFKLLSLYICVIHSYPEEHSLLSTPSLLDTFHPLHPVVLERNKLKRPVFSKNADSALNWEVI